MVLRTLSPMLLIAEREFRAYASTLSFWIALAIGPLLLAGAVALAGVASHPAAPVPIGLVGPGPEARAVGAEALRQAASLDHHAIRITTDAGASGSVMTVVPGADGLLHARFSGPDALSPAAQALAARTVELASARARLGLAPLPPTVLAEPAQSPPSADQARGAGRFAVVMMLWLTLTGSLGMLLQAVVRERANRALESLLAAASAMHIALGKLLGVGAVSLLVLGAWLGAAAALSPLAPGGGGIAAGLVHGMTQPAMLLKAALIYPLAFAFYGLLTIAVGARARDTAAAQNLSRPMFTVLLVAFFVALAAAGGAHDLAWLSYLPPFAPFMLLLQPAGAMPPMAQGLALALLALASGLAGWLAVNGISVSPAAWPLAGRPRAAA